MQRIDVDDFSHKIEKVSAKSGGDEGATNTTIERFTDIVEAVTKVSTEISALAVLNKIGRRSRTS